MPETKSFSNDPGVKNLKPDAKEYYAADNNKPGLYVRVRPNGTKSFILRYKPPGGHAKRLTIGKYPEISLKDARQAYDEARQKIRKGADLNLEKRFEAIKAQTELSVQQAFDEYKQVYLFGVDGKGKPILKAGYKQAEYFDRDILREIGDLKIREIEGRHLITILDKIVKRGSNVSANRTLSAMKSFLSWCIGRKIIDTDPSEGIKKRHVGGKETPRKHYLSKLELKKFWLLIDEAPFSIQVREMLKILCLTGQRVSELAKAERGHVDLPNRTWTVPIELSKNDESNRVPLHEDTTTSFEILKMLSGKSRYICQSLQVVTKEKPTLYTTVDKSLRRVFENKEGRINWISEVEKFTVHDFRRTLSTHLGNAGIPPYICEKILNHKMHGMMAVYNDSDYMEEKAEALGTWQEMNTIIQLVDDDTLRFFDDKDNSIVMTRSFKAFLHTGADFLKAIDPNAKQWQLIVKTIGKLKNDEFKDLFDLSNGWQEKIKQIIAGEKVLQLRNREA